MQRVNICQDSLWGKKYKTRGNPLGEVSPAILVTMVCPNSPAGWLMCWRIWRTRSSGSLDFSTGSWTPLSEPRHLEGSPGCALIHRPSWAPAVWVRHLGCPSWSILEMMQPLHHVTAAPRKAPGNTAHPNLSPIPDPQNHQQNKMVVVSC